MDSGRSAPVILELAVSSFQHTSFTIATSAAPSLCESKGNITTSDMHGMTVVSYSWGSCGALQNTHKIEDLRESKN
jgi:hypothetical protein